MAASEIRAIKPEDLNQAVRSVARALGCTEIVIIGSQALLVGRDDIATDLRYSREIDLYPADVRLGAVSADIEVSEEINALFGEGSNFDRTHGFFIDGVDHKTARLPKDWRDRAVRRKIEVDGKTIAVVAPEPNDLVVSKLVRGDPKDLKFTKGCLDAGLVKYGIVNRRLGDVLSGEALGAARRKLASTRDGGANNYQLHQSGLDR